MYALMTRLHSPRVMMKMLSTVMDAITAPVPEKCLAAQDTDWLTFIISVGLAFGIVLSYLPQVSRSLNAKLTIALSHHPPQKQ